MLHYTILHYITLYYTTLYYILLYTMLHYTILHYITLYYITLYYILLYTMLHYTILYITLHYATLHYIIYYSTLCYSTLYHCSAVHSETFLVQLLVSAVVSLHYQEMFTLTNHDNKVNLPNGELTLHSLSQCAITCARNSACLWFVATLQSDTCIMAQCQNPHVSSDHNSNLSKHYFKNSISVNTLLARGENTVQMIT